MSAGMRNGGNPSYGDSPLSSLAAAGTELRSHPIVTGIGAAAAVSAALAVAALLRGQPRTEGPALAAFTIVAGISFVSAGLVASARRPERWTGALMIGAGFALFAERLVQADTSVPFTIGLISLGIPAAVLAHLVLVFPDGRLHSSWERLVVGAAYL